MALPIITVPPPQTPVVDGRGLVMQVWQSFFAYLARSTPGAITVATQPALAASDAGRAAYVSDTKHFVVWNGTAWEFTGDAAGRYEDFASAPDLSAYALCDGSGTTLLTVGATLTLAAFVTPNLAGDPAFAGTAYIRR